MPLYSFLRLTAFNLNFETEFQNSDAKTKETSLLNFK